MIKRNIFLLILGFFPLLVKSQEIAVPEKEVAEHVQFWTSVNSTMRLNNRWGIIADAHIRRDNYFQDTNFYFLRVGGAYWLDDRFSLAGGVAALWLATPTEANSQIALERRIYQQVLWRDQIQKITFLQRIRVEERWHEVLDKSDGSLDRVRYSTRFRFLMSATVQVFDNKKLPRPVLANEIHFQVGPEILYNTFDQNRLFIGINQRLNPAWSFDLGYMMVYQQLYSGYQYNLNHTIRFFFYYSPDFRTKKDKDLLHYPVNGVQ